MRINFERALEVCKENGHSMSSWQGDKKGFYISGCSCGCTAEFNEKGNTASGTAIREKCKGGIWK